MELAFQTGNATAINRTAKALSLQSIASRLVEAIPETTIQEHLTPFHHPTLALSNLPAYSFPQRLEKSASKFRNVQSCLSC